MNKDELSAKIKATMSTYVMSDLHGCKKEFDLMLDKIGFSSYDELWIVGDICDRGNDSTGLLKEIMSHDNMHIIYGNHDLWLERYIDSIIEIKKGNLVIPNMSEDFQVWFYYNGGNLTVNEFMDLEFPEIYDIKLYLENKILYKYLTVKGNKYLLVHAGLPQNYLREDISLESVPEEVLLWAHIGIDDNPFKNVTMIVGHTPTFIYGEEYSNKIIHGNNIYHIDGGCVYGRSLACLRLDDLKEFYIPSSYPKI